MSKLTNLEDFRSSTTELVPIRYEESAPVKLKKPTRHSSKQEDSSGATVFVIDGPSVSDKELEKRLRKLDNGKDLKPSKGGKIKITDNYKFSEHIGSINQFLENDEGISAQAAFNKRMLQSMLETIPIMEESLRVKQTPAYVYALNQMIDKARDLMYDLTEADDGAKLASEIEANILIPAFLSLGKSLLLGNDKLLTNLSSYMTCDEDKLRSILDGNLRTQVEYVDIMNENINKRLRDRLGA